MDVEEYKHKVQQQLIAYDFAKISADDLEEQGESFSDDERKIVQENELFLRICSGHIEVVLIAEVPNQSVEDLKSMLIEFLDEDDSIEFEKEYRLFILLIADRASKAMKTVAKRYTVEEWPEFVLPVLIGIEDESFTHHEKTGLLKSITTLHSMGETAEEYFKVQN
ncbi:hypothetical protein [Halobacterium salinarum]|uniref:hypothetical protein n=1 Tax=Halobacterium salinarum TaxID=2242 RepID=UPI002554EDEC|nr:hypothetical protein [Halobacterium salinarum]MDL0135061.1 hypothetical protein [Halobacterium salinarum]